MSVAALLAELRRRDIRVWADGDRLLCDAPRGALTPELRAQLGDRKGAVLEFLRAAQSLARQERAIVPLQPRGTRAPVFAIPGHNGDVFCYRALARCLGEERPFFGLEPPGLDGFHEPLGDVAQLAAYFAAQIRAFQGDAPCIVAGYCAGGTVALELARQLQQRGTVVPYVALFGAPFPTWYRIRGQLRSGLRAFAARVAKHARALAGRSPGGWRGYLREKMRDRRTRMAVESAPVTDPILVRRIGVEQATLKALRRYAPAHFAGRIGLFLPFHDAELNEGARHWRRLAQHTDEYFAPPGADCFNLLREPHVFATAELVRHSLGSLEA